jgi:hypothetical protein
VLKKVPATKERHTQIPALRDARLGRELVLKDDARTPKGSIIDEDRNDR